MTSTAKKHPRAGQTAKISVSLDRDELAFVRRRARRLHGGNVSAVIAESVQRLHEEEGRQALTAWLGKAGEASAKQRNAIRAEWKSGRAAVDSKYKSR